MKPSSKKHFSALTRYALLALSSFLNHCSQSQKEGSQPQVPSIHRDVNVLLITVDTLRADYLSCYGGKAVPTPNYGCLGGAWCAILPGVCPSSHDRAFARLHSDWRLPSRP